LGSCGKDLQLINLWELHKHIRWLYRAIDVESEHSFVDGHLFFVFIFFRADYIDAESVGLAVK
jgi:hypothetical protein